MPITLFYGQVRFSCLTVTYLLIIIYSTIKSIILAFFIIICYNEHNCVEPFVLEGASLDLSAMDCRIAIT